MEWPVEAATPDSKLPVWPFYYLAACPAPPDPTIVWGTDVDVTDAERYLKQRSGEAGLFLSLAHVLVRATAVTLRRHPEFNRRVIGKRVHAYRDVSIVMPMFQRAANEVEVVLIPRADELGLIETATFLWNQGCAAASNSGAAMEGGKSWHERLPRWLIKRALPWFLWGIDRWNLPRIGWLRRENVAVAMVNYFGSQGSPPMRAFKPSRFPNDAVPLCLTMGATEERVVAVRGEVVVRRIAPLFFRADHRTIDGGYAMRGFLQTLRSLISDPAQLESQELPEPRGTSREGAGAYGFVSAPQPAVDGPHRPPTGSDGSVRRFDAGTGQSATGRSGRA